MLVVRARIELASGMGLWSMEANEITAQGAVPPFHLAMALRSFNIREAVHRSRRFLAGSRFFQLAKVRAFWLMKRQQDIG